MLAVLVTLLVLVLVFGTLEWLTARCRPWLTTKED
jgi:hypothetical protein